MDISDLKNGQRLSIEDFNKITKKHKSKKSKFNAKKTIVDGITFDSAWEAKRYSQLKILEKIGDISNLSLQVKYPIHVNNELICNYIADFVYEHNDSIIVEDAKGFLTPEYKLKKKLMKAIYGIEIFETKTKK